MEQTEYFNGTGQHWNNQEVRFHRDGNLDCPNELCSYWNGTGHSQAGGDQECQTGAETRAYLSKKSLHFKGLQSVFGGRWRVFRVRKIVWAKTQVIDEFDPFGSVMRSLPVRGLILQGFSFTITPPCVGKRTRRVAVAGLISWEPGKYLFEWILSPRGQWFNSGFCPVSQSGWQESGGNSRFFFYTNELSEKTNSSPS